MSRGETFPRARLELDLRVWAVPDAGDLDNFVTGICDGLIAAHSHAAINAADWADLPDSAHPERPLVLAMTARSIASSLSGCHRRLMGRAIAS